MYNAAVAVEATAGVHIEWKFEIGQCVTHTDQALPSLVMWRGKGGDNELYGIRSFAAVDDNRDRLMLGDKLRHAVPNSADCDTCLLHSSGLCPGLLDGAADESLLAAE